MQPLKSIRKRVDADNIGGVFRKNHIRIYEIIKQDDAELVQGPLRYT